jgi:hypothetical protein
MPYGRLLYLLKNPGSSGNHHGMAMATLRKSVENLARLVSPVEPQAIRGLRNSGAT